MSVDLSLQSSEDLLKSVSAWQTGHFLLTSGLHSDQYMQCQRVLQYPRLGQLLADRLIELLNKSGVQPTAVIGPALGAIHWELFVAQSLDKAAQTPVKALFAERAAEASGDANSFVLRRGMELEPADKVLVVEDVCTTGGSVMKVLDLVKKLGAKPIGVGTIVDRSGTNLDFGVPFFKLITLNLQTFAPEKCPLCAAGSHPIKPGSSKKTI